MSNTYYKVDIAHSHKPSYSWELFPALLRLVTVSRLPTFYSANERLRSTPCKPETGKSSLCSLLLSCYTLNKTCHTHTTYITICITVLVDVGTWSHTDISWFGRICSWKTLYKVQEYPSSHLRACRESPFSLGCRHPWTHFLYAWLNLSPSLVASAPLTHGFRPAQTQHLLGFLDEGVYLFVVLFPEI